MDVTRAVLLLAGSVVYAVGVTSANAELTGMERELVDDIRAVQGGVRVAEPRKKVEFLAVPIPLSNPTIGFGLAVAGGLLYRLDPESKTSISGVGGFYSTNRSWGAALLQSTFFGKDKYRIDLATGFANVNYEFFGIGSTAGEAGISIPLRTRAFFFVPKAYVRVAPNLYLGARYRFAKTKTRIRKGTFFDNILPGITKVDLDVTTSGFGPLLEYNTTDNQFAPTKGFILDIGTNFAQSNIFGTNFNYQQFEVSYNHYWKVTENSVIAARIAGCFTTGRVPFFDLCSYGSNSDLRGYETGRYQDRHKLAGQLEYRWQFTDRLGVVAFGGIGGVAPSLGDFRVRDLLPAGGAGLRYKVSKQHGINFGVDVSVGRNGHAIYFRVGEAF